MIKSLLKEGVILLANRLKILLAERDLTIKDLMKATGLSRNSLSNMVNNPFANIATDNVDKLCNYLEVAPKDFYDYFPWHFSMGYSLRKKILKYRYGEEFEVGYFLISASSGHKKLDTGFTIFLESSLPAKEDPSLTFSIKCPTHDNFNKLFNEMSPLFRHTLQEKVVEIMKDFCADLDKEYFFNSLYQTNKNIKVSVVMYGKYNDDELFNNSYKCKFQN